MFWNQSVRSEIRSLSERKLQTEEEEESFHLKDGCDLSAGRDGGTGREEEEGGGRERVGGGGEEEGGGFNRACS